jgi:Protein of unknown function (DUF4058)
MPTPFPGMDPYLERAGIWEEVHTRLIVAMADALGPHVRPKYRVGVEQRTYLALLTPDEYERVGKPDVLVSASRRQAPLAQATATAVSTTPRVAQLPMPEEITERYLEVRDVVTGEVITIIELLSPTNKLTREGRRQYMRKRLQVLGSAPHFIEIDLLRAGEPFPFRVLDDDAESDYRMIVSRAPDRPQAAVYLFTIRDPIPDIPVPLQPGDPEPSLALNLLLHDVYDRAGYDLTIDYQQSPPHPRIREQDIQWMKQLVPSTEAC